MHNYLRQTENTAYCLPSFRDSDYRPGYWKEFFQPSNQALLSNLQPVCGSRYAEDAAPMGDDLKDYVNS